MSGEGDEGDDWVRVRSDHYNDLTSAADLGYETLVRRRNALRKVALSMETYPDRNSHDMKQRENGLLDGIEIEKQDVEKLVRDYDGRIERLARAMNARLHQPRYK